MDDGCILSLSTASASSRLSGSPSAGTDPLSTVERGSPVEMTVLIAFAQRWAEGLHKAQQNDAERASMFTLFVNDPHLRFHSPAVAAPYTSKPQIAVILGHVLGVLEHLTYSRILYDTSTGSICMEFSAKITAPDGKILDATGIDLFRVNSAGLATELKVFIRPLKAVNTLAAVMARRLYPDGAPAKKAGRSKL
jgi:hypothetical protein